jgi:glycosyltransferase involved in cell wall biosynthesis
LPRSRILFTSAFLTPFIREDLEVLQRHYRVRRLLTRGILAPVKILSAAATADVTFTWFASVYSSVVVFAARLFGIRAIIVVGGVDAARVPEIGYGIWLVRWKAVLVGWALRHAHRVLAVAPSLKRDAAALARYDGANIEVVPTGYDAAAWVPCGEKEPSVLTVAVCENRIRARTKGIDLLFATARLMPETSFVLVGIRDPLQTQIRSEVPGNVKLVPYVEREVLRGHYQKAKVYCQPSYTEGLPNALCEAMLCGCIPVGTAVGGIPDVIGDTGYVVQRDEPGQLVEALRAALRADTIAGLRARDRIAGEYTAERREQSLIRTIDLAVQ